MSLTCQLLFLCCFFRVWNDGTEEWERLCDDDIFPLCVISLDNENLFFCSSWHLLTVENFSSFFTFSSLLSSCLVTVTCKNFSFLNFFKWFVRIFFILKIHASIFKTSTTTWFSTKKLLHFSFFNAQSLDVCMFTSTALTAKIFCDNLPWTN